MLSVDDNSKMYLSAETDVFNKVKGWQSEIFRLQMKKSAEQNKTLYLLLRVFHMQFPGYFAQGHNKFGVSAIQTESNRVKKKNLIKTPQLLKM